ncbi:4-hydroxy-tetrahydrodipicolinate synthase [Arthrobacter sp. NPDC056886]|uniref:4-hydroxy-tetrahydrodipicolinate synthase n=1 Tax=Arthrobacter sp. NPDC056886 TaxID=3345960 RepID=UPI00366C22F5
MSKQLQGVLTALATPFDQDGAIDVETLRRVVDRSVDAGVDGVVAAGSTGEVGALSSEERLLLIDTVIKQANGRVPVIAQTGATSTAEAVRLSQAAEKAGADVLMLITPYYEPLSLEETVTYIKDVARSVKLPVMLYNIPAVTGVNLDPATVRALAEEVDNIRYIKDSSANWEQALQLIHHHGDVIGTFIGWDVYLYSALVEGAAGVMAGTANVIPDEIVAVSRLIAEGDLTGARELWKQLYPVVDALLSVPFIPAIKAGISLQGLSAGSPRRPTADLNAEDLARVQHALSALYQNVG